MAISFDPKDRDDTWRVCGTCGIAKPPRKFRRATDTQCRACYTRRGSTRVCSGCGIEKPPERFPSVNSPTCMACYQRARFAAGRPKPPPRTGPDVVCSVCGTAKPPRLIRKVQPPVCGACRQRARYDEKRAIAALDTPDDIKRVCDTCHTARPPEQFYHASDTTCRACLLRSDSRVPPSRSVLHARARARKRGFTSVEEHQKVLQELKEQTGRNTPATARILERLKQGQPLKPLYELLGTAPIAPPPSDANFPPAERARIELARRELARRSLVNFILRFHDEYKAGWVHQVICAKLEKFARDVKEGRSPRLMLFLPPRSGKSIIASKLFPAWFLGHYPMLEIIACSYAVALPVEFSRAIRDTIALPNYKALFPATELSKTSNAAEAWKTKVGGGYVAAGISGPITGKGANVLILDDVVKDAESADSEVISEATWNWYGSTARTRLAPGGGILVIMTRWSEKDLAGRLLYADHSRRREILERGSIEELATLENWEVLSFPAIAEHDEYLTAAGDLVYTTGEGQVALRKKGEALHPERFDLNSLQRVRHSLQPRHWQSLYQQNPTPEEGSYFVKEMVRYEPTRPEWQSMTLFAAWDLAIGQRQQNDWTVGVVGALDWNGDLHVVDMIRGRMNAHEIALAVVETALKYGCLMTGIEKGQLELAIRPEIDRLLREKKRAITLAEGDEALRPVTDKLARARPLQGMMQRGRIVFPADQTWTEVAVSELLRFPNGLNDDIVDALAWLARMTINASPPTAPEERFRAPVTSWKDKLKSAQGRKHFMAA